MAGLRGPYPAQQFCNIVTCVLLFPVEQDSLCLYAIGFHQPRIFSHNIGLYNFIVGFIIQIVTRFGFPYSDRFDKGYMIIWLFFPPNLLAKALKMLTYATATHRDPGISWSGRTKCSLNDDDCIVTMADVEVSFKVTEFKKAEELDPTWTNPQILCSRKGANVEGGLGPFGFLTLTSDDLEEYTTAFFRTFKATDKYICRVNVQ